MGTNRFGVDVSYFECKMKLIIRDLDNYTPSELYRELTRLADVAVPTGLTEVVSSTDYNKQGID